VEEVPVVAEANAGSTVHIVELARFAQQAGAAAVSVAAPRLFAVEERDLLWHFDRILSAIDVPLVLQDYNPGGPTVSTTFIAKLHRQHPHFRWVKLEEPLMAARVASILDATSGEVGVLEGWGGMYLLELVAAGISGVMPSLSLADLLARIFRLAKDGHRQEAYEIFTGSLPIIVYSFQNMELFHHTLDLRIGVRIPASQAHSFVYSTGRDFLWRSRQRIPVGARHGRQTDPIPKNGIRCQARGSPFILIGCINPKM
jgi:4-hydroxy-tetrahydrodipicolinate synthase